MRVLFIAPLLSKNAELATKRSEQPYPRRVPVRPVHMRPGVLRAARLATGSPLQEDLSPPRERDPWTGNADWRHGLAGDAYLQAGISPINASSSPPTHFCSLSVTARPPATASLQGVVLSGRTPPQVFGLAHRPDPSWTSPGPHSSESKEAAACYQKQPSSSGRSSQHGVAQPLTPGFTCSTAMEAVRQRLVGAHARGDMRSLRAASQAPLQAAALSLSPTLIPTLIPTPISTLSPAPGHRRRCWSCRRARSRACAPSMRSSASTSLSSSSP